jgi:hypothetical protein
MTEPELKDNDVFHVIGFKYPDVLSGAPVQLMRRLGMPAPSGTKLVEVYFLDSSLPYDPPTFKPHEDYRFTSTVTQLWHVEGIRHKVAPPWLRRALGQNSRVGLALV